MGENKVFLKGTLEGIQVHISPHADLEDIKLELGRKLDSSKSFFKDTKVNFIFTGREIKDEEKEELTEFIFQKVSLGHIDFNIPAEKEDIKMEAVTYSTEEGMAKFHRGTIRNGQRMDYEGNIIIMGDVNPGAEIVAGGNIIVLGHLRGMAHAGAYGDTKAVVIALCLQPTQLRIGNIITRSPEDEMEKPLYPEIAYIKGENLFIEPYTPGKLKF